MDGGHDTTALQQSLVHSAQSQMAGAVNNSSNIDMASVLARLQALEKEKHDLRLSLDSTSARLSKLQEGKRYACTPIHIRYECRACAGV